MRPLVFSCSVVLSIIVLSTAACESESTSSTPPPSPDASQVDAKQPTNDASTSLPDAGVDVETPACPIGADATVKGTLKVSTDDNFARRRRSVKPRCSRSAGASRI